MGRRSSVVSEHRGRPGARGAGRVALGAAALAALAVGPLGCSAGVTHGNCLSVSGINSGGDCITTDDVDMSTDDAESLYLAALYARGVPAAPPDPLQIMIVAWHLGHAVCSDIKNGSNAGAKVMQIASLQLNGKDQFTLPQAEEIVYWAITDLCPDQMSQRQDHWRDGQ